MMTYKIVGDSSCDLNKELEAKLNIEIAPLSFELDGVNYIDDETLDVDEYVKIMNASPNVPKSACPSPHEYMSRFEGDEEAVFAITLSAALSGSYNSAENGKALCLEQNPSKKIHIFNSKSAASGETLIALKIKELVDAGLSFEDIVEKVENYISTMRTLFVLDKIDTLEKNGRLSSMKAKIVKVLNLKLILTATSEGTIDMLNKARGSHKALAKMVDLIGQVGGETQDKVLAIAHCNNEERALAVKEMAQNLYEFKDIVVVKMRGLSSTYSNDGGIVIAF